METENYCPVCGDSKTHWGNDTWIETNAAVAAKSPAFRAAFECFLELFEVSSPPWLEKRFMFCKECEEQLSLAYELEEVLEDTDKELITMIKMVKDKFSRSEGKFQMSGIYKRDKRDKRYWELRCGFRNKGKFCLKKLIC